MSGFFGCISDVDCVFRMFFMVLIIIPILVRREQEWHFSPLRKDSSGQFTVWRTGISGINLRPTWPDLTGILVLELSAIPRHNRYLSLHIWGDSLLHTVSKIANITELEDRFMKARRTFAETSQGSVNPTELIAMLIAECDDFTSGIENVFNLIKGSCSLLILTEDRIIAARDKLGRTPIVIGKKEGAYAASFETCAFPNLNYEIDRYLGPGEIVSIGANGCEQLRKPNEKMQICSFLWGLLWFIPPPFTKGSMWMNAANKCGAALAKSDTVEADFVAGHTGFRSWPCDGIQQCKRNSFQETIREIYSDLAKEFYATESVNA